MNRSPASNCSPQNLGNCEQVTMAASPSTKPAAAVLALIFTILGSSASRVSATATLDNVAVQWNYLFNLLTCRSSGTVIEPSLIFAHLHLAQWHSLLALKRLTDSEESQELVVAFASHTILSNYFVFEKWNAIDPLLYKQLNAINASTSQTTQGRRLGEAVAHSVIDKRRPGREFTLRDFRAALDSEGKNPRPGLYRYINDTPAGRADAIFVFYDIPIVRPYVVSDPLRFIQKELSFIKPPYVPSSEWDAAYASIVDAGSADNPRRTAEMNITGGWSACPKVNAVACFPESVWNAIARSALPPSLSLYDTVAFFTKLAVTMHDALIVLTTLQYGFWFWRPQMAIREGDSRHKPIPTWTSWRPTPPHPEYPSGTVTSYSAAARVLERFFNETKQKPNAIILPGGGAQWGADCPMLQGPIADVKFSSFADAVAFGQRSRVFVGAHYQKSVDDAVPVGAAVAKYVWEHWDETAPSGVLPDLVYLDVVSEFPKQQQEFSPLRLDY